MLVPPGTFVVVVVRVDRRIVRFTSVRGISGIRFVVWSFCGIHWFISRFICWLICWFVGWLVVRLVFRFVVRLVGRFVVGFVVRLINGLVRSFVRMIVWLVVVIFLHTFSIAIFVIPILTHAFITFASIHAKAVIRAKIFVLVGGVGALIFVTVAWVRIVGVDWMIIVSIGVAFQRRFDVVEITIPNFANSIIRTLTLKGSRIFSFIYKSISFIN